MQYILPNNIEKQRQLRGTSPKELYIPFNTGRRTGIKENTERDNFFTTRPALDKLKLSQWINNRITDGTIEISSTGLQGTGINPRIALWDTNGTLTDSAKLRLYSRTIGSTTTSELFITNSTANGSLLTIGSVGGANSYASLRLTANITSTNLDSQLPSVSGDFTTSLNTYPANYTWNQLRGLTLLITGSNSRRLFINTGTESEFFPDITLEKEYGSSNISFGYRFSSLTNGIDASRLGSGINLPTGDDGYRPSYSFGAKAGLIRYNNGSRKIETYVQYGTGFSDDDYVWHDVVTTATSPITEQQRLSSTTISGQIVWVSREERRVANATATTSASGEVTVALPAGWSTDAYVVHITNRSATTPYFINVINKTTGGFTFKVFTTAGTTANNASITFDYYVSQI
jgi:hypothetical protein